MNVGTSVKIKAHLRNIKISTTKRLNLVRFADKCLKPKARLENTKKKLTLKRKSQEFDVQNPKVMGLNC